jgi:hypothetical protein
VLARRLQALAFTAFRRLYPDFPYQYEKGGLDVINGGHALREWVDEPQAAPGDLDALAVSDERAWTETRRPHLLY